MQHKPTTLKCVRITCAEHTGRGELTYVHCKAGRGRSTTLVLCYLVKARRMAPSAALVLVRGKRPQVHLAQVRLIPKI